MQNILHEELLAFCIYFLKKIDCAIVATNAPAAKPCFSFKKK